MYVFVDKTLLECTDHKKCFLNLLTEIFCEEHGTMETELDCSNYCDSRCNICDIIKTLFHNMVTLLVKVSMAQFRRDYLSALKVDKDKALKKKVMKKCKAKTKQLNSTFLQADESENKQAFHLRLKSDLFQGIAVLNKFQKSELITLCAAYDIKLAKSRKKCDFIDELSKKALICDVILFPKDLQSKSATSEIFTTIDHQNIEFPATELPASFDINEQPAAVSPQPGPSTATCSATLQPETDIGNPGPLSESDSEIIISVTKKTPKGKKGGLVRKGKGKNSSKQIKGKEKEKEGKGRTD
ncbi:unnamed protein product [Mytilus edulis]|uniref:Uncharacterized protein n=1 Tax=Mytilus edulis TaxID=6550 RepID=A0A8S3VI70_MYTED|nr:unnamed protein product [Mytilus edulis]